MDDETYDAILQAVRGDFHVPVKERTKIQRTALIRFWRNRHKFEIAEDGKTLLFDGKSVAKKTDVKGIVKTGLEETKGCGARKLNVYLRDKYSGISSKAVRKVIDMSKRYHLHKASFRNKPIPKPIRAKAVEERHQIDILDMGKWAV